MAVVAMASSTVNHPDVRSIVLPLLSALPAAAMSSQPAPSILPLLSPILRQRVQVLSAAIDEAWLRLLSYQPSQVPQLSEIARSGLLEPHPVSGEIEVDWDSSSDVLLRFKRVDQETLQGMVVLHGFNLYFRLVHCTGDGDDGGGWRVGEVGVATPANKSSLETPVAESVLAWSPTVAEAESSYHGQKTAQQGGGVPPPFKPLYDPNASDDRDGDGQDGDGADDDDDDDDDGYWDQYDATPARTPAAKRSPAPRSLRHQKQEQQEPHDAQSSGLDSAASAEDAYFAQYDSVQPALDNDDPDGASGSPADDASPPAPPLGLFTRTSPPRQQPPPHDNTTTSPPPPPSDGLTSWTLADALSPPEAGSNQQQLQLLQLQHPRPASSAGGGSQHGGGGGGGSTSASVARLEDAAARRDEGEFGVRQHVARSIRSLYLLCRAAGIDRDEFERMVHVELDVLGLVEEEV